MTMHTETTDPAAMTAESTAAITGKAAGVPFLAIPPRVVHQQSPVVVAWHLMDPPRTEAAFAAALPLAGFDGWRIYLGLPLCGARLPTGGFDALMQLGFEDAVLKLQGPIASQGAAEFPAAWEDLKAQLDLHDAPLALVGGSMGSAVAQLVLAETGPAAGLVASAAVLISPISQLRPAVDATGRLYGVEYPWGPESLDVARRLDFVRRAKETAAANEPAIRLIVGADDDEVGFVQPAQALRNALAEHYSDQTRVDFRLVAGMGHAVAEEPGIDPAPQTDQAREVDRLTTEWLNRHLGDHG
ncbi:pimeloyl-ACP methyl ester carboxylesterase [Nakamurella sp. UYEF19]|uniref:alpha/beta hydrolase family protein n=1 Tax=Nakamurella sp. UYEF19 TaxID=1756392 RepID=UPI003396EBE9